MANDQKGKHDAVLDFLIDKHGHDAEKVVDTIVELLNRRELLSPDPSCRGLTESNFVGVFRNYCGGALDLPPATVAKAAAAPAACAEPSVISDELLPLAVTMSGSAQKALEKARSEAAARTEAAASGSSTEIKPGTQCKHSGCDLVFSGPSSLGAECVFHPGQPVFHEGYKYWSCCPSHKTTEFHDFMGFAGCKKGSCIFIEDEATKLRNAKCRYDFYQVGPTISMSIYAKKTDPDGCSFHASSNRLTVHITYDAGLKSYDMDIALFGPIDPTKSKAEILGPKVELTLVKADGTNWTSLGVVSEPQQQA